MAGLRGKSSTISSACAAAEEEEEGERLPAAVCLREAAEEGEAGEEAEGSCSLGRRCFCSRLPSLEDTAEGSAEDSAAARGKREEEPGEEGA
jgi:hypothetical protein